MNKEGYRKLFMQGFFKLILEDLKTHRNDPTSQGFLALAVHRISMRLELIDINWIRRVLRLFYLILRRVVEYITGITIDTSTYVGRHVHIWHHSGIILNADYIGDNVVIRQNTTLGVKRQGSLERPKLLDGVELGCGVVVLGGVTIGEGVIVGANSVIIRSIDPHSVVAGNPARVIHPRKV